MSSILIVKINFANISISFPYEGSTAIMSTLGLQYSFL